MRVLTCVILNGLIASQLCAQLDDASTRRTLGGLHGVFVLVESIDSSVAGSGLGRTEVQMDVEVKLREAGIPVLTRMQSTTSPGQPYLYVNLELSKVSGLDLYAFHIAVQFVQNAHLDRNPSIEASDVGTWAATPIVGTVGLAYVREIRDAIRDRIDQFINAYLAANPKR
jgi:hypothetical protein